MGDARSRQDAGAHANRPARRGLLTAAEDALAIERILGRLATLDPGAVTLGKRIAKRHGVLLSEVVSTYRGSTRAARAKQELWSVLEGTYGLSWVELGEMFERDHSTILTGVKRRRERFHAPVVTPTPPSS